MSAKTQKKKPARSAVLPVIALCFLASAALRGALVAEAANDTVSQQVADQIASEARAAWTEKPKAEHPSCDAAPLIEKLKEREAEFERREASLNERSAKLEVIEARLKEKIEALETARTELESTVARVDGAQSRDIEHLVTMYSTMKPKRAGELFNQMDVKFASELLIRAKPEIAALILANMDAENAFTASLLIARRNQSAPKN